MAKTKTLGIRTTPQLITELEELKDAFDFGSYSEMLASLAQVLRNIDQRICELRRHPRAWDVEEVRDLMSGISAESNGQEDEITRLVWRRVKERFGEDGVESLRQKVLESTKKAVDR